MTRPLRTPLSDRLSALHSVWTWCHTVSNSVARRTSSAWICSMSSATKLAKCGVGMTRSFLEVPMQTRFAVAEWLECDVTSRRQRSLCATTVCNYEVRLTTNLKHEKSTWCQEESTLFYLQHKLLCRWDRNFPHSEHERTLCTRHALGIIYSRTRSSLYRPSNSDIQIEWCHTAQGNDR